MRTLELKKETLAELTADDLRDVVGARPLASAEVQTCVATVCTDPLSLGCYSWHTEEC
jgi:hypothetical protein